MIEQHRWTQNDPALWPKITVLGRPGPDAPVDWLPELPEGHERSDGWTAVIPSPRYGILAPTYVQEGSGWPWERWDGLDDQVGEDATPRRPQPDGIPGLTEPAPRGRWEGGRILWINRAAPFGGIRNSPLDSRQDAELEGQLRHHYGNVEFPQVGGTPIRRKRDGVVLLTQEQVAEVLARVEELGEEASDDDLPVIEGRLLLLEDHPDEPATYGTVADALVAACVELRRLAARVSRLEGKGVDG